MTTPAAPYPSAPNEPSFAHGPNVIGATGGSGTRVVARIVRAGGMFIGTNLNKSEDALDFGGFSDRWINAYMARRKWPLLRDAVEERMVADLDAVLARHCAPLRQSASTRPWGWKEPRSIYLLPFFHRRFPQMKFLHVVRDGRDMAFSENQNQLRKHGDTLLKFRERFMSPALRSIILWNRINLFAAEYGENILHERYLRVRFEDLCNDPVPTVQRILDFFDLSGNAHEIARSEVVPPASLGRWQTEGKKTATRVQRVANTALRKFDYEPLT
jgi:hypothetical protein